MDGAQAPDLAVNPPRLQLPVSVNPCVSSDVLFPTGVNSPWRFKYAVWLLDFLRDFRYHIDSKNKFIDCAL